VVGVWGVVEMGVNVKKNWIIRWVEMLEAWRCEHIYQFEGISGR